MNNAEHKYMNNFPPPTIHLATPVPRIVLPVEPHWSVNCLTGDINVATLFTDLPIFNPTLF